MDCFENDFTPSNDYNSNSFQLYTSKNMSENIYLVSQENDNRSSIIDSPDIGCSNINDGICARNAFLEDRSEIEDNQKCNTSENRGADSGSIEIEICKMPYEDTSKDTAGHNVTSSKVNGTENENLNFQLNEDIQRFRNPICKITTDHVPSDNMYEIDFTNCKKDRSCPQEVSNPTIHKNNNYPTKIKEMKKFLCAVNLTNKDMLRKSSLLLQKQNLVTEIISYIQAAQSILRLSTSNYLQECEKYTSSKFYKVDEQLLSNNLSICGMFQDEHSKFYKAGEYILDELKLYLRHLKSDFKVWEDHRLEIVEIYKQIPSRFEFCKDEMAGKVLMHHITKDICDILKKMEDVSAKREERNEESIDLMDGVDTFIKYSSAFVMGKSTLTVF